MRAIQRWFDHSQECDRCSEASWDFGRPVCWVGRRLLELADFGDPDPASDAWLELASDRLPAEPAWWER